MRCEPSWSWPSQMLAMLCRLHIIPLLPPPARYAWYRLKLVKFRFVRHVPDSILQPRQKAVATATVLSVPLPAQGSIVEIFTGHNQSFIRDIQKELVPRSIAYSGYRWHNSLCRPEMLQILRSITIRKGGVYVHWDTLDSRSEKTNMPKFWEVKQRLVMPMPPGITKLMSWRWSPSSSELRPTTKNSALSRRRFSGSQTEVPSSAPIIL
jgi:hypothetical protein